MNNPSIQKVELDLLNPAPFESFVPAATRNRRNQAFASTLIITCLFVFTMVMIEKAKEERV